MIHAYASRGHYADHIRPIWDALSPRVRGEFLSPRTSDPWGSGRPKRLPADDVVIVASYVDSQKWARSRVVYVEHGAGQTYDADPNGFRHGSYAGGDGHAHTVLFVSPREEVAARWRARYDAPVVAVGCPKLDKYHDAKDVLPRDQTVAFSFHWDNPLCPESRSALPHYQRALPAIVGALRERGWRVLGHGHPRAMGALARVWRGLGVPVVDDQDYVLRHASVFVADNTSAMYEAAAVGIPVVVLNAPWYRRTYHHGMRFWSVIPGAQVNDPGDVVEAVERAQQRERDDELVRVGAVRATYAHVDGQATARAVKAILEVI